MSFHAAGFLSLLVPWAVLAWLALRGRPAERVSTAVFLWGANPPRVDKQQRRRPPPGWIILALLSMFAAIVALARPFVSSGRTLAAVVLLDNGMMMSNESQGKTRIESAFEAFQNAVTARFGQVTIASEFVLPDSQFRPSTLDTAAAMMSRIDALRRSGRAVVVITDQAVDESPGVVRFRPPDSPQTRGIELIGITPTPAGQAVMVRVVSPADLESIVVRSDSSERIISANQSAAGRLEAFFEFETREPIEVRLLQLDDYAEDDVAWIVPSAATPTIAITDGIPPAARRFARAFDVARPAADDGESVVFTNTPIDSSCVVFESTGERVAGVVDSDSPLLDGVDTTGLSGVAVANVPEGFSVIATLGGRPIVATRDSPRAVWIGIVDRDYERSPGWVILLANAVDWISEEAMTARAVSCNEIGRGWRLASGEGSRATPSPGVYIDEFGRRVAVNRPAVRFGDGADDAAIVQSLQVRGIERELSRAFSLAAAGLILAAAVGRSMRSRRSAGLDRPGGQS